MRSGNMMKGLSCLISAICMAATLALLPGCGGSDEGTEVSVTYSPEVALAAVQQAIAASGAGWVAGITDLSQLSDEEKLLLIGDDGMPSAGRVAARVDPRAVAQSLPATLDWRDKDGDNWITSVKDQGRCNSCVAFASVGVVETLQRIARNDPDMVIDLSEADLYSCGGGKVCSQTWGGASAAAVLQQTGVTDEACLPYSIQNRNLVQACDSRCGDWESRATRIASYETIRMPNDPAAARALIKTKLQNGPVVGSMAIYEDYYFYVSGVYQHVTGAALGGHAVMIVGYNDTEGYWIIRNSYGPNWGESGYMRIKYDGADIEIRSNVALTVPDVPATVTALAAPTSLALINNQAQTTLTCSTTGVVTTLEGRCKTTDAWSSIASGTTMTCTYTTTGSFTPGCRVNSAATDDLDTTVTVAAACGNSTVDAGEQCDSGASNGTACTATYGATCTYCSAACQNTTVTGPSCGDSTVQAAGGEQCDSGASNGTACTPNYGSNCTYCSATCQNTTVTGASCGDSVVQAANGEQCDSGATNGNVCTASYGSTCNYCTASCQTSTVTGPRCGDSNVDAGNGETCDDGNTAAGDGCSSTCQSESTSCDTITVEGTCQGTAGCYWNPDFHVCRISCALSYTDQVSCDADWLCDWDAGSTQCLNHSCPGYICSSRTDSFSCSVFSACVWTGTACVDGCGGYLDQGNCNTDANCYWVSDLTTCIAK